MQRLILFLALPSLAFTAATSAETLDDAWQAALAAHQQIAAAAAERDAANFDLDQAKAARLPNVVFILADDLGWCELGCYGQKKIKTPNIDRLAAQGTRLTRHYCGSPVCAPSRCVLMTGKNPGHAFIRNNREVQPEGQQPIPADEVTIASPVIAASTE